MICKQCNKEFIRNTPNKVYCSKKCRDEVYDKKEKIRPIKETKEMFDWRVYGKNPIV